MSMKTQGSQLYTLIESTATPGTMEVMEIQNISNFNGGGNPADQIEDTSLANTTRSYQKGLRTPSQATFNVYADPRNASHVTLHDRSELDESDIHKYVFGWSDGRGIPPTVNASGDDFELPDTRTWFVFEGYVADFPFDFQGNSVVQTAAAIQKTGPSKWIRKGAV